MKNFWLFYSPPVGDGEVDSISFRKFLRSAQSHAVKHSSPSLRALYLKFVFGLISIYKERAFLWNALSVICCVFMDLLSKIHFKKFVFVVVSQFANSFFFDLTHAFASKTELVANFFEGHFLTTDTEEHF